MFVVDFNKHNAKLLKYLYPLRRKFTYFRIYTYEEYQPKQKRN